MDVVYSTVTELAAAIRSRRLSAVEVLEAHLAQIARHNPALNAIITLDAEGALTRARAADAALARGETWGPLHGVPFALKDAHATAGMRTTTGFPPFDHVPARDGTIAARLRAAGAILFGKTNVAMMLADYQTNNPIFGRTNNPWDVARTPGGSSGGASAAIAAGMTPFDIATDLGGSIRIPASFTGIYGLKPTEHRVSLAGVVPDPHDSPNPVRIMSTVGPMARTVDDLALLYTIIAGVDDRDTDVPPMPVAPVTTVRLRGLRVAVATTFARIPVARAVREAIETLAGQLQSEGATVDMGELPEIDIGSDLREAGRLVQTITGAFQPPRGAPATLADYLTALARRDASIAAWERFFDAWDVMLCPCAMVGAFTHREIGAPIFVDDARADYYAIAAHTMPFNYGGQPAIALPMGCDAEGMPIGAQLVSKRWSESRLLGIASAVAALVPGFVCPPGYERSS